MTFGLFTNVAPKGSHKHIYIYIPSSGELSSPGLHHPVLTGSPLPGTHIPFGQIDTNEYTTGPLHSSTHLDVSTIEVRVLPLLHIIQQPPTVLAPSTMQQSTSLIGVTQRLNPSSRQKPSLHSDGKKISSPNM